MAIPTALFMVMVSLFLATLVTVKAREDMRLTGFQARQVQAYYLSRAAAEDALARLRRNPSSVSSHGPGNPFHDVHDGYELEGWAQNHPTSSRILLIHGKAYREGNEEQAEYFTISVTRDPIWDGLIWVRAGDSLWVLKGNSWAGVSDPPLSYNYVLTLPGVMPGDPPTVSLEQYNGPRGSAADLTNFTADVNGNLYAQYIPPGDARPPGLPAGATVEPLPTLLTYNVSGGGWSVSALPAGSGGLMASSSENLYTVVSDAGGDRLQVQTPDGDWADVTLPPGVPAGAAITSLTAGGRWDVSGPTSESNQLYAQFQGSGYNGLYKLTSGGWESVSWPPQMSFTAGGEFQTSAARQPLDEIVAAPNGDLYGVWKRPDGPDTLYSLTDVDGEKVWSPMPPMKNYTYQDGEAVARPGYVSDLDNLEVDFRGHLMSQTGGANSLIYGGGEPIPPIPGYGGAYQLLATGGYNTGVLGNFRTVSSH